MPSVTVDNQRLFYTKQTVPGAPPGQLPALLLLHGAGGSHLDWPAALRRFPGTTVVALDLPGHGRSEPPGRDRVEAYADMVATFLGTLSIASTVLVGHSMGGAIALRLGASPPPGVVGMALVGTGALLRVSSELLELARSDFAAAASFINRYEWGPTVPDELRAAGLSRLAAADPAVTLGDFVACDTFDMRDELGSIHLPALVIGGGADRMAPLRLSVSLAEGLPHARLVTLPGAGHMIPLEQPAAVSSALRSFLSSLS